MKLYGVRTSPYVRHARVALAQSDLDWELEQVTLDTIGQSPTCLLYTSPSPRDS